MSDQTAQEPTMEEILASIRRIISEDDQPQAAAAEAAPEPAAGEPEPEEPLAFAEEDVLELTEAMQEAEPALTVGDLDVYTPAPARAEPAYEPAPAPSYEPEPEPYTPPPSVARDVDALVGRESSAAAASAFGALTAAISMPRDGRTLEDVTRELLKPLLKQWLDDNLPRVVEAAVKEEVERISRSRA